MTTYTQNRQPIDWRVIVLIALMLLYLLNGCAAPYPIIQGKAVSVTFSVVGTDVSTTLVCDSAVLENNKAVLFTNGLKQEILLGKDVIANKSITPHIKKSK